MKQSSVVAITRGRKSELEVLWSQRQHEMPFLGGFWAFAGGGVLARDREIPLTTTPPRGFPAPEFYGCAARELFEEHGLLVTSDGLRHVAFDTTLAELRGRIIEGGDFGAALRERSLAVPTDRFWPIGRWITPEWFDVRFDSEFFDVHLTSEESARFAGMLSEHLQHRELARAEWASPAEALRKWRAAKRFVTPPIRFLLEAYEAAEDSRDVELSSVDVDFDYDAWLTVDGVYVIPLRSPTIPPATHTNCIVVGTDRFVVIDPGSPFDREQELLQKLVGEMVDDGRQLEAVVITHHHPDHVGGVRALVDHFDCPVWAHPTTSSLVGDVFDVGRQLRDGELIGHGEDILRCVFTPGHASDHLVFLHERTGGLIAGDLVASRGTILVNPPDGHMGSYLDSLRRARQLEPSALYPAHGWVVTNPREHLDFYLRHRLEREEEVFGALRRFGKPATAMDLVPDAYDDAPRKVWPIAQRSAHAHLIHLEELGRVTSDGEFWKPV